MMIYTMNDDETYEQAGAKLGQAQVKLEVIVEVGVKDRCIYLIPSKV